MRLKGWIVFDKAMDPTHKLVGFKDQDDHTFYAAVPAEDITDLGGGHVTIPLKKVTIFRTSGTALAELAYPAIIGKETKVPKTGEAMHCFFAPDSFVSD